MTEKFRSTPWSRQTVLKMRLFRLIALTTVLLMSTSGAPFDMMGIDFCINSNACQCVEPDIIQCTCPNNHTQIRILPFHLLAHKSLISFAGCDLVEIDTMAMSTMPPSNVAFINIRQLILHKAVYHDVHTIDTITIADTSMNEIVQYTFFTVSHVALIEFRNVTIGHLRTAMFQTVSNVDTFIISGSTIDTIHEKAFNDTLNIRKFRIVNSVIRDLRPFAVMLRNVEEFALINTTVLNFGNRSLTLVNASHVLIESCRFQKMDDSALTTMLTNRLQVTNNVFERLSTDAWNGVTDASNIMFVDNKIWRADTDSFAVLLRRNSNGDVIRDNFVTCDEHLCWMFEEPDLVDDSGDRAMMSGTTFFDRNFCLTKPSTSTWSFNGTGNSVSAITLAVFSSLGDDEDICQTTYTSGAGSSQYNDIANVTVNVGSRSNGVLVVLLSGIVIQCGIHILISRFFY